MSKRKQVSLKECYTNIWTGHEFVKIPLHESPFYVSLKENNEELYETHRTLLNSTCGWIKKNYNKRKCRSYKSFKELYLSIKNNGWDSKSFLRFVRGFREHIISDGQHRACILLHLNKNTKILRDGRIGTLRK